MNGLKIFDNVVTCFVRLPIWFFLVYTMLSVIHPDRLVWFLFWIYLVAGMLVATFEAGVAIAERKAGAREQVTGSRRQ